MSSLDHHLHICGLADLHALTEDWDLVGSFLDPELPPESVAINGNPKNWRVFRINDIINPLPGKIVPARADIEKWIAALREVDRQSRPARILIHCHLGRSRSVAAAAIAIAVLYPDRIDRIPELLREIRDHPWPNARMLALADDILALGSRLSQAGGETRIRTAREDPEWVRMLLDTDHREIAQAALAAAGNA